MKAIRGRRAIVVALATVILLATFLPVARAQPAETSYTSPQFGYRVTWQEPWRAGPAISVPGDHDDFLLTTERGLSFEYYGLFTALPTAELLRTFGEARARELPGAGVRFQTAEENSRLPMAAVVTFTSCDGVAMEQTITVRSLVPRQSALLWIVGKPADLGPDVVRPLARLVTLELGSVPPATPPATSSSPVHPSAEASPSATAAC